MDKIDKWMTLKRWVSMRHDQLEAQYKITNFSADAADLGVLRAVYQTMRDLDEQEQRTAHQKQDPTPARAAGGKR